MLVKLNVGSFVTQFADWRNSDILPLQDWSREHGMAFSQWSIEGPIPYDDGVVDLIFACHVLEHVNYEHGAAFLRECHRVMKPGAVLRILVPDTFELCQAYLLGRGGSPSRSADAPLLISRFDEFSDTARARKHAAQKLWELLAEGGHHAFYDIGTLTGALYAAGFEHIYRAKFGQSKSPVMQAETKDLYPGLSLIVEAVK